MSQVRFLSGRPYYRKNTSYAGRKSRRGGAIYADDPSNRNVTTWPYAQPEYDYSSLIEQHFNDLVACYEKYKRAVGVICDPDYIILPPVYVVPRELVTPLRRIFF